MSLACYASRSIFPLNLYDPFGFNKGMSDEKREKRLVMEINNGRLAMVRAENVNSAWRFITHSN